MYEYRSNPRNIRSHRSEIAPNPKAMEKNRNNSIEEDRGRAWKAVSEKMLTSFPKTLRQAVGLAIMERKLCDEMGDGENDDSITVRKKHKKADDGGVERLMQMALRKEVVKLSPQAIVCMLLVALEPQPPLELEDLTFALVETVVDKHLLLGYSSAALVGGCLSFAAAALQFDIEYEWDNFDKDGIKINWHGERCAYNALWLERGRLESVVRKHGGSLSALSLPVNAKGKVAEWMLMLEAERWQEYRKQQQAKKARERCDIL